ncbi:MAG: hypothetical protein M3167_10915 [Acidobacteriota bacterium]|nr:hypothetical protein [Acidobacteriota bacterium]
MRPTRRRSAVAGAAGAIALVSATAVLYVLSRGKWSDPIIDSGREWIVPDALGRGKFLYRDVVYWFGPFTPYAHAAFFRVFGSSLATLVLAGAAASAAVLAALFFALRTVTGRREASLWTALAVPVLVFMPNAGGPLLGMGYRIWHAAAFSLAAIALSAGPRRARRTPWTLAAAGAIAGLAGLCRIEWGLVALGAAVLVRLARARSFRTAVAEMILPAAGFLLVIGAGLGTFVVAAGKSAVLDDGHVFLTGLPEETRTFLVAFAGLRDWRSGLVQMVYSAAMWLGGALVVDLAARPRPASRAARVLLPVGAVLAVTAALGGASGAVLFSAAPLLCAAALWAGFARRRGARGAATLAFAAAGLILSYRRPFHIGDSAYVGPPLLFAFVSAAALLRQAALRAGSRTGRVRLAAAFRFATAAVVAAAFAGRALQYASDDRIPIPGTDGMLSARAPVVRDLQSLAGAIRSIARPGDALVAMPEGELANLLTGLRNPIRHMLYIPGYLTDANEPEVLRELAAAKPRIVVIWNRSTSEYGRAAFGEDYARGIRAWIDREYEPRPLGGRAAERQVRLMVRR